MFQKSLSVGLASFLLNMTVHTFVWENTRSSITNFKCYSTAGEFKNDLRKEEKQSFFFRKEMKSNPG